MQILNAGICVLKLVIIIAISIYDRDFVEVSFVSTINIISTSLQGDRVLFFRQTVENLV